MDWKVNCYGELMRNLYDRRLGGITFVDKIEKMQVVRFLRALYRELQTGGGTNNESET